jgi:hypothetical protein
MFYSIFSDYFHWNLYCPAEGSLRETYGFYDILFITVLLLSYLNNIIYLLFLDELSQVHMIECRNEMSN